MDEISINARFAALCNQRNREANEVVELAGVNAVLQAKLEAQQKTIDLLQSKLDTLEVDTSEVNFNNIETIEVNNED